MEGFIEYVGRVPTIRTRESNVRAHYIAYKKIHGEWLRFDDAAVHRVVLNDDYKVNLLFYRRNNVPEQQLDIYLDVIPHLVPRNISFGRGNGQKGKETNGPLTPTPNFGNFSKALPLRPPLITHQEESPKAGRKNRSLQPENPSRHQPQRPNGGVMYAPDSDSDLSDAISLPSDKNDSDYLPIENKGTFQQ